MYDDYYDDLYDGYDLYNDLNGPPDSDYDDGPASDHYDDCDYYPGPY